MGYENCGSNPNSRANLLKGSNLSKLASTDPKSKEVASFLLNEKVEYNGAMITKREAILREQLAQALDGDLRSCQFIIELAGLKEQPATGGKTEELSPLEQLQAMMRQSKPDKRRRKIANSN